MKVQTHPLNDEGDDDEGDDDDDGGGGGDDVVQDVFKESERGLTRSPTTFDQSNANTAGQDSDHGGAGHTDRSYGKSPVHDQSRHDRKKKDEARKKLEPSMKWRLLESDKRTDDKDKDKEVKTETKGTEKQIRVKSSGHTRNKE